MQYEWKVIEHRFKEGYGHVEKEYLDMLQQGYEYLGTLPEKSKSGHFNVYRKRINGEQNNG
jgi:hypothetical protein